jgi:hypothetical protein
VFHTQSPYLTAEGATSASLNNLDRQKLSSDILQRRNNMVMTALDSTLRMGVSVVAFEELKERKPKQYLQSTFRKLNTFA